MSNIVIDNEYSLTHDRYAWQLNYRHEGEISKKTGKPMVKIWKRWYPNLELALNAYKDDKLKIEGDVLSLINKLNDVRKTIKSIHELRVAK